MYKAYYPKKKVYTEEYLLDKIKYYEDTMAALKAAGLDSYSREIHIARSAKGVWVNRYRQFLALKEEK